MKFCWALPVIPTPKYQDLYQAYVDQSKLAEQYGFDSVLFSITPTAVDPFVVATRVGLETESIRLLIAQNTSFAFPTATAKAMNTLNTMLGSRVDLNIVTGSSAMTLSRDTRPESHQERYCRTREFATILQLLRHGITTYNGNYFAVANSDIYPKDNGGSFFVAGSSEDAMSIAAEHGDYDILYACDYQTITQQYMSVKAMAADHNRSIHCGVVVDIIARETSEEAWEVAQHLLNGTDAVTKRLTKIFLKSSDSVGMTRYRDLTAKDNYMVDEYLWGGLSQINPANSISIVGSYQEVIAALRRFQQAGADYFLITSLVHDKDIERMGTYIIPYMKSEKT